MSTVNSAILKISHKDTEPQRKNKRDRKNNWNLPNKKWFTDSNEALPFETSDPANVTIVPPPDPQEFEKETLTWSVDTLLVGADRTLEIKIGTAQNPSGRLEPTSTPQTIYYNGQDNDPGKRPTATANGGLSVSVDAVTLTNGEEINCAESDGQWDPAPDPDKCTKIITTLPITKTGIIQ